MFAKLKISYYVLFLFLLIVGLMVASIFIVKNHENYGFERIYIDLADTKFTAYSDGNTFKGSSIKTINTPSQKGFDCIIEHLDQYPYCVLTIDITDADSKGIDFTDFSEMKVVGTFETPDLDFLRIGFRHFDPAYSSYGAANSMKFNQMEIKSQNITDNFIVEFSRLTVPSWWVAGLKKEDVNDTIELNNIRIIEVSTGTLPAQGEYKLRIEYFVLEKEIISLGKVYEYLLISWAALLMLLMFFVVLYLVFRLKQKNRNEKILLEINSALSVEKIELEAISQTDALTGALNRFGLQKQLVNTVRERQYPSIIIIIDIDHFKSINDEFGHQQGDYVLEHLCSVIKGFLRNDESLSRYGGEEFLILMPNVSADHISKRLEEIRIGIQEADMKINREVTASFGVAQINKTDNIKQVIGEADKALYIAKTSGRNCIKFSQ